MQNFRKPLLAPKCDSLVPRVIPCLLIENQRLVKTIKFRDPKYVGDPLNAVRIFNDKQADELVFLDIGARKTGHGPDFDLIEKIAQQCFMPFAYGGGIQTLDHIRRILSSGVEKVVINSAALKNPELIRDAAEQFGSQSVVVSVDVKRSLLGSWRVFDGAQNKNTSMIPLDYVKSIVAMGAGEVFMNDVDRDGTRIGYDLELISTLSSGIDVPLVASGGAGNLVDLKLAIDSGAAAAAAGSLFVLYGKHRAVLITYPQGEDLRQIFY
jgi:cyclase